MEIKQLHKWDLPYAKARAVQESLAGRVRFSKLKTRPKLVAGLDCAFSKDGNRIFAAAIVLRLDDFEIVETTSASAKTTFPYIPGLLSSIPIIIT